MSKGLNLQTEWLTLLFCSFSFGPCPHSPPLLHWAPRFSPPSSPHSQVRLLFFSFFFYFLSLLHLLCPHIPSLLLVRAYGRRQRWMLKTLTREVFRDGVFSIRCDECKLCSRGTWPRTTSLQDMLPDLSLGAFILTNLKVL